MSKQPKESPKKEVKSKNQQQQQHEDNVLIERSQSNQDLISSSSQNRDTSETTSKDENTSFMNINEYFNDLSKLNSMKTSKYSKLVPHNPIEVQLEGKCCYCCT